MGEIISSLKEFVWDIIGYLIPGFLLIITLNFFLMPDIGVENSFILDWEILNPTYIIIVLAYVLGFVVYGLTMFKIYVQDRIIDKFQNKGIYKYLEKYHSKFWEKNFEISPTFKAAKDKLLAEHISNASNMKINEVRNIFMSRSPEMDQKVYTFMFRSSVFDHTSTIMMLVVVMSIFAYCLSFLDIYFIKYEKLHIVLYLIFPFLCIRLGNAKRMFYSISQRIPMSNLK
ncbi:hypothetical protein [Sphingobacterium multivorum]|uniref:hypothetical protein n=1 Tax=Sphingobacterium multivorum TaxID=28454 RepID=UPI00345ED78C